MKQISFDFHVVHLVAELSASDRITEEADTFGRNFRQPTLSVFTEKHHRRLRHLTVRTNETKIPQKPLDSRSLDDESRHLVKRIILHCQFINILASEHRGETLHHIQFDGIGIKIFNGSIAHCLFIGIISTTVTHHVGKLRIVKYLTLVRSILNPYYTFIVMIRLVFAFWNCCYDNRSTRSRYILNVN